MSTEIHDKDALYGRFGIQSRYDSPQTYGRRRSHFGDGKYPPDWAARRNAVWWLQEKACARCGRDKGSGSGHAVHHVQHLEHGGSNDLQNLVGLCADCHSLMHPNLDWMRGEVSKAPVFPSRSAEDEVTVVRWPSDNPELRFDLGRLAETSAPTVNERAVTDAAVPTDPEDARRAGSDIATLLKERGAIARTSPHHTISVEPTLLGLRGLFTSFEPPTRICTDGDLVETGSWNGRSELCKEIRCSADTKQARIDLRDGHDREITAGLSFDQGESERELSVAVSPPPFTRGTAPGYVYNTIRYLARTSLFRGILPAIAVSIFAGDSVQFGGSIGVFALLVGVLGFLLTIPTLLRKVVESKRLGESSSDSTSGLSNDTTVNSSQFDAEYVAFERMPSTIVEEDGFVSEDAETGSEASTRDSNTGESYRVIKAFEYLSHGALALAAIVACLVMWVENPFGMSTVFRSIASVGFTSLFIGFLSALDYLRMGATN